MFKKIGDWFKKKKEELTGEDIREDADLGDKIKMTNEGLKEELVEEKEKIESALGIDKKEKEEAERKAQEAKAKEEAERKAQEAKEKEEAERKAQEAKAKEEAERKAQEAKAKEEAERKAQEAKEKEEAERKAQEAKAKEEAERKAQEAKAKEEAERKAQETKAKEEAERKAQEAKAKEEAERKAQETKAKEEAEKKAQEAKEKEEAERKAQETKAKEEAERKAQEAKAKEEAERKAQEAKEKEEKPKKKGFFEKLVDGLDKTRKDMTAKINNVFSSYHKVDEELFDDLEEIMVTADVGINTTMELIDKLRDRVKQERVTEPEVVRDMLIEEIKNLMTEDGIDNKLNIEPSPAIILVVGVNGVGKTTTIGKLSNNLKKQGKKVLVAAGDTFRAAAIEQLEEWGNRANVDIISHSEGADPAAVIYDGIQAAKARKTDVLICDTAGRLHNKKNLMNELNKIFRVVESEYPEATKEVLLVLDATTGQNAILQAKTFKEVANITGIALTKLDGTAKGGVVIALQSELGIPVKLVGVGEQIDDLQEFNSEDFVKAIFQ